jgi:hypothetical protein
MTTQLECSPTCNTYQIHYLVTPPNDSYLTLSVSLSEYHMHAANTPQSVPAIFSQPAVIRIDPAITEVEGVLAGGGRTLRDRIR